MNRREGVELIHERSFAIGWLDALTICPRCAHYMSKSEAMNYDFLAPANDKARELGSIVRKSDSRSPRPPRVLSRAAYCFPEQYADQHATANNNGGRHASSSRFALPQDSNSLEQ